MVLTNTITRGTEPSVGNELVYERRFGARNQIEAVVPSTRPNQKIGWQTGLGDVALAFRRTVYANIRSGSIAAAGGEVALPDRRRGSRAWQRLPRLRTVRDVRPGAAAELVPAGARGPRDSVGQRQGHARGVSADGAWASPTCRIAGFGRSWSPQVELLWARPFGERSEWDLVPQLQVSLSKIQHVVVAAGVRVPLNAARRS